MNKIYSSINTKCTAIRLILLPFVTAIFSPHHRVMNTLHTQYVRQYDKRLQMFIETFFWKSRKFSEIK